MDKGKRVFESLTIALLLFLLLPSNTYGISSKPKVILNNQELKLSESKFLREDWLMINLRDIVKIVGGEIIWDSSDNVIKVLKDDINLSIKANGYNYEVNNRPENNMSIYNNGTFVTPEFISVHFRKVIRLDEVNNILYLEDYPLGYEDLTDNERELAILVNEYRKEIGLSEMKVSKSLTKTARLHSFDQQYNYNNPKDSRGMKGNLHSWSDQGSWIPVVYTPDHEYSNLMWSKPSELTKYKGSGYEISAYHSMKGVTPKKFLEMWKSSPDHNNVIVGDGYWESLNVMGISLYKNHSNIWFGKEYDPEGYHDLK